MLPTSWCNGTDHPTVGPASGMTPSAGPPATDDDATVPFVVRAPSAVAYAVSRAARADGVSVQEWVSDALRARLAAPAAPAGPIGRRRLRVPR